MAGGTGYDFIRAVRADPQLGMITFVFITSTLVDEKDRAEGLALGASRFLFRPIEPKTFLEEIRACLRESRRRVDQDDPCDCQRPAGRHDGTPGFGKDLRP